MQQPYGPAFMVPANFVVLNCATVTHPASYQLFPTLLQQPEAPAPKLEAPVAATTICFRNIPNNYTGKMVTELLDANGFKDSYNFLYVPHDFKRLPELVNVGYFFANFITHDLALRAWDAFNGYRKWALGSSKVLAASWATKTQGYRACVLRYQDSMMTNPDVPLECRPMFFKDGQAFTQTSMKFDGDQPLAKTHNELQFGVGGMLAVGRRNREPTTLCFRNIPNDCNGKTVQELLDGAGFKERYNFVYVPHDFKVLPTLMNVGYFFANFTTHGDAVQALDALHEFQAWRPASNKALRVSWATKTQGLDACIQRYKDSPVLRQDIPFECKPMRFENGQAVQLVYSFAMQVRQSIDGCQLGQTIADSGNAQACVEEVIGYNTDGEETEFRSTSALSILLTSGCSSHTEEESTSSMMCVPNEAASPDSVEIAHIMRSSSDEAAADSADICANCETQFTFLRRRHHCRSCGRACCAECAPRTGKDMLNLVLKRLCMDCANQSGLSDARPSGGDPPVIVQNTFLSSRRNASIEDMANRIYDDTSFPC
jgi:hypothetical protein